LDWLEQYCRVVDLAITIKVSSFSGVDFPLKDLAPYAITVP